MKPYERNPLPQTIWRDIKDALRRIAGEIQWWLQHGHEDDTGFYQGQGR